MRYDDEDEDEGPQPDATLEQGLPLPVRMQGTFPAEVSSIPLEDIDPFYHNQRVRIYDVMFTATSCERYQNIFHELLSFYVTFKRSQHSNGAFGVLHNSEVL